MKIVSDILGFLGILITVTLYQQRKRESLLLYKLLLDSIWVLHYCFIGAYSGAAVATIAAIRGVIFVKRDPKRAGGIVWLPIFISVAVISTALTWKTYFSLFTCLASCIAVVSFFIGNPRLSRMLAIPISGCMLTYNFSIGTIAGIVNECLAIISSLVGMVRIDRKSNAAEAITSGET